MLVGEFWPKCNTCGGKLIKAEGVYECDCCGNKYPDIKKAESKLSEKFVEQLNSADNDRKMHHFDKALDTYNAIIERDKRNVLANWGAFLSEYGVEYVREDGLYVPRIHLITRIPATQSKYLQAIYKLCDELESADYRIKAEEIERVRNSTYEMSRAQEKYDVFILHGESDFEADTAQRLFNELKASGYRVFMPSKSIPYKVSPEACIFAASESASTMFVIADSISTLAKNDYIWERFIQDGDKKIQVLHSGLNESEFPYRLRKTFQKQAPINLKERGWLNAAIDFAGSKKQDKKPVAQNAQTIIANTNIYMSTKAESLSEAMVMLLTYVVGGNIDGANGILFSQFAFPGGEQLVPIAHLCIELTALSRCSPAERPAHIGTIQNLGSKIKTAYPVLSEKEREVYGEIGHANLLLYLAKCFGSIKDRSRQCFVLDMIDYRNVFNPQMVTELAQMLLANGRTDEVGEVMRGVSCLDGNAFLLSYLKGYAGSNIQKQVNLLAVADKLNLKPAIADDLNAYLAGCDDEGVALAVVSIMNRYKIPLNTMGLGGALLKIKDAASVRIVLENIGKRPLVTMEIDRLITIAANGGSEVANEVLKHLRYQSGIVNLGAYNMHTILENCDLAKIKTAFFDFEMDKKLANELLMGVIKGKGADRLATVSVLVGNLTNIEIKNYEQLLLGGDPLKKEFMKLLAPKTGKYSDANKQIEAFLCGRDSDEDKREIFEMFGDFPFSKRCIELYLDILPESFDESYVKYLYPYLEQNPSEARKLFVKHYERCIGGYERHLEKIFGYVRAYDETGIRRFITEFKGSQAVKDALIPKIVEFADKPKKIDVVYGQVQCNLLQAYLLTMKSVGPDTDRTIQYLRKKGMDAGDKVFVGGRKMKFKEYVQSGVVDGKTVDLITAHTKL